MKRLALDAVALVVAFISLAGIAYAYRGVELEAVEDDADEVDPFAELYRINAPGGRS